MKHQPPPDDAGRNDYHLDAPHFAAAVPHSISETHDAMRPCKLVKTTTDNVSQTERTKYPISHAQQRDQSLNDGDDTRLRPCMKYERATR